MLNYIKIKVKNRKKWNMKNQILCLDLGKNFIAFVSVIDVYVCGSQTIVISAWWSGDSLWKLVLSFDHIYFLFTNAVRQIKQNWKSVTFEQSNSRVSCSPDPGDSGGRSCTSELNQRDFIGSRQGVISGLIWKDLRSPRFTSPISLLSVTLFQSP